MWCEAVDRAVAKAVKDLDPKALARDYGNPLARSGVGPVKVIGMKSADEMRDIEAARVGRLGRILGDRMPEDEDA